MWQFSPQWFGSWGGAFTHPGRKWKHRKGGGFYRQIRTTAERRANQDWPVRPSRRPHRLPNAWDDIIRDDHGHRSWKRHRKTQYKARIVC